MELSLPGLYEWPNDVLQVEQHELFQDALHIGESALAHHCSTNVEYDIFTLTMDVIETMHVV